MKKSFRFPLGDWARRRIGELRWKYRCWKLDPARVLQIILSGQKNLFVVQIGSNDGVRNDPIHWLLQRNPSWKALLVEPIPAICDRLRANYSGNHNVRIDKVAIAEEAGSRDFYYVAATAKEHLPDLPYWFDQLGSFDREHIARELGESLESFIVSTQITALPLATVLNRNLVTKIDVLHIDTEGYDWVILSQLDQARFHPEVILFEHIHLSESDKHAAEEFLKCNYHISDLGRDYLCRRA